MATEDSGNDYLTYLEAIASDDAKGLLKGHESYGNSWKSRGGVGAFMNLARKWDRLDKLMAETPGANGDRFDIFAHIEKDPRVEGALDDVRDLRRYLLLVEAELTARGIVGLGTHRDNQGQDSAESFPLVGGKTAE